VKLWWLRSLELHAFPVFGKKPVDLVDSADVLKAITPIWTQAPDMARKVLARTAKVMDTATIRGYRTVLAGNITVPLPNPCAGIRVALPKQPKNGNHAALAYKDIPEFLRKLHSSRVTLPVRLAIEFTIVTACRTSEVIKSTWNEFDLEERIWRIPGVRMKMAEPHEVPLSDRAMEILEETKKMDAGIMVFPSATEGKPLSQVTMLKALQRMKGCEEITMHGFRSGFKTWATERTKYRDQVSESCLAHKFEGLDQNYLRTTFPEHRRRLMEQWSRYCIGHSAARVVKMHA
jgi:integrase